jgi:hypothetical protein
VAKPSPAKKPVAKKLAAPPPKQPVKKPVAKKPPEEKPTWNDDSPFMPVRTDKH